MKWENTTTTPKVTLDWRLGEELTWTKEDEKKFKEEFSSNGRKPAIPTPRHGDPANKKFSWQ